MPNQSKAIAFDVDPASLLSLREAFPEWEIEAVRGTTSASRFVSQDRLYHPWSKSGWPGILLDRTFSWW